MAVCISCGNEIAENAKFCNNCGAPKAVEETPIEEVNEEPVPPKRVEKTTVVIDDEVEEESKEWSEETTNNPFADLLKGTKTKLLDTRKTTPGMRVFEKYAVKVGGGYNHRFNLSDGILLKDNHIGAAGGVKQAVAMAKEYAPFVRKIEIEVENLDMLGEALEAGADIIMLDNMSIEDMKKAVELCAGKAETECSGNVTKENVAKLTDIGVDYISSGALTHSSPILDLSLKNLHVV